MPDKSESTLGAATQPSQASAASASPFGDALGIPVTSVAPQIAPVFGAASGPAVAADSNFLLQLMDSLPVLVSFVATDLRYGWVNRYYEGWFGRSRQDIVGKTMKDLLGDATFQRVLPHARQALAGEVARFENTLARHDGKSRHVDTTYVPYRATGGAVQGMAILALDVTQHVVAEDKLRESELRFRQLAENIDEVFWMSSPDGEEVFYVSPAFERIWQRSCAELYGRPRLWLEAIHPDDSTRVRELYTAQSLARGKFNVEYRIVWPDGTVRWIHDRGFPVRDDAGRVLRIAGFATDVTDLKQAQDRERQLLADLAHMARLTTMGEMATGLAHELNQPLAAIINYVDGAMQLLPAGGELPPELRQAMEGAAAEAERAGEIIHRMKNFLRRTEPQQTAMDLNVLMGEALDLAAREIRLSGARLQLELATQLPPALADRIQIEQVVLNLVRNALDAMQQTPVEERVLVVQTARDSGATIRATVCDSGCGLPAEAAAKLFQPFFTTKPSGMGMGLAISRTIVTAHGGRLEAAPGPEGGAAFSFTLPVAASETVS
ncbi:MAG TPA: PAS domain-containing protein [Gemmataceae bacterium]|nr:PAS domain-containing protein [Gemmataceae bacterium]